MSTTTKKNTRAPLVMGLALATVVTVTGWLALREFAPGNMGTGFLVGGGAVIVLGVIALARTTRHPERASTAERTLGGVPDERDASVLRTALATLGGISFPLTAAAAIALAVGAPTSPVIAILLWAELLGFVTAFYVANRRS